MKVALIMMFRDEADILEQCLAHWQRIGVDRFFLCDNGSKDASPEIARKYCPELMTDKRTDWPGPEIINTLKNRAVATNHTWVFPVDADEFLQLPDGCTTIQEWLRRYPQEGHAVGLLRYLNFMPSGESYWQNPHKKVFGKFAPAWRIVMGNHFVEGVKETLDPMGAYYKHYSMRTYPQFKVKMENYMTAFNQLPFKDHPHAQSYREWKVEGERYIMRLWETLTGLPAA
jgi:hypothetical protein